MRRFTLRVTVALLTFAIGILVIWFASKDGRAPEPADVDFCHLVRNPDDYSQKVVRAEAILYFSDRENGVLYDGRCASDVSCADIAFDVAAYDAAHEALERAYRYGDSRRGKRVKVVAVGKFFQGHDRGYTPDDGCRYGFDILRIERVEPVPDSVPWR